MASRHSIVVPGCAHSTPMGFHSAERLAERGVNLPDPAAVHVDTDLYGGGRRGAKKEWGIDDEEGGGGGGDADNEAREKKQRQQFIMNQFKKRRHNNVRVVLSNRYFV